jgi:hypothetical protein
MTFAFGSRSGTAVALVLFIGVFGVLGVTAAIALARRVRGASPGVVGILLFVVPVTLIYVSSLGGFYELELRSDVVVLHYLTAATVAVPTARVSEVVARPAFRGRWRLQVRETDGQAHDSATWSRAAVDRAVAELRTTLRERVRPPGGR